MNPHRAAAVLAGLWLLVGCVADPQQAKPESPAARSIESRVKASILDAAADAEKRGDNSTALGYYRSAYQQDPTDVAAILGLSRLLRGGSHANEAVTIAERGLEAHKKHPQITAELGKAQLAANDTLKAIETLSLAGTMSPNDWEIESALGVSYDRISMYEQAAHRYEKALALRPGNAVVMNNYALSLAQAGQLERAVALLEKATSAPERTPLMRQNLALLYAMTGRIDATERLVRQDLPAEMAEENLAYYRRVARNSNRSSTLQPGRQQPLAPVLSAPSPRSDAAPAVPASDAAAPVAPVASADLAPPRAEPAAPPAAAAPPAPRTTAQPTPSATADAGAAALPAADAALEPQSATPAGLNRTPSRVDTPVPLTVRPLLSVSTTPRPAPTQSATPAAIPAPAPIAAPASGAPPGLAPSLAAAGLAAAPAPPSAAPGTGDGAKAAGSGAEAERTSRAAPRGAAAPAAPEPAAPPSTDAAAAAPDKAEPLPALADTGDATPAAGAMPLQPATSASPGPATPMPSVAARPDAPAPTIAAAIAPAATSPATETGRLYRVQIGSYRSEVDAKSGIEKLHASHEDLIGSHGLAVVLATVDGTEYYRVLTSPMASKSGADALCAQLQSREVGCFIRRDR